MTRPKRSSASATAATHSASDGHVEVAVGRRVAEVGGDGLALLVEHVGEEHRAPSATKRRASASPWPRAAP